jgi:hypothetical protein
LTIVVTVFSNQPPKPEAAEQRIRNKKRGQRKNRTGKANKPNTETKTRKHRGGSFHSTSSTSRLHHHRLHPEQKTQRESKRKEPVRVKKAKGGTEEVLHKASKSTKSTDVLQDDTTSRQLK